ncbi:MAG: signal peptidase I [Candidatus Harrisonbacteria bacterium CG10_big_fil_rev_8_21_14_0_10_38_8]|uniref:Signal peptidase I n=1 Tax=Candidatus Harrisonbacteria bacterium CG10_big_fil_rev_8_21_14_0_10_38_8 TaxID=1974582 RepID=A0A2M6WJT9_9BACT|nr:MAG: signal peptidase I [Candidatus Harrisonbacteria bacterium CG10_big_fil_rev_8_21_14_0_10_38_8]
MAKDNLRRFFANLWEVLEILLIAFITVYVIRTFIGQPFLVSGASMEPSFEDGNYLLIDELTYRFRDPVRGEVIVFKYPGDNKSFFIKRIIGLPGESIQIRNNEITVIHTDGSQQTLLEDYTLDLEYKLRPRDMVLDEDEYFVMGDNRGNSFDSRNWGALEEKNIVGLVRLRLFPVNEIGTLKPAVYN